MDRIISNPEKPKLFQEFEYADLFPYTIAVLMICAEIYIVLQFIAVTPVINY